MKNELIGDLRASFELSIQLETETGTEIWLARDLQSRLGYLATTKGSPGSAPKGVGRPSAGSRTKT